MTSSERKIDEYYEAALAFCQEHGYTEDELPPFRKGTPSHNCPITIALDAKQSAMGYIWLKDGSILYGGNKIRQFIKLADMGYYPQLGRPHWY